MIKILFVCHGNICRSTMAEFVLKDLIEKQNRKTEFYISSAGTSREEIGNPVHYGTARILDSLDIDYSAKRAVQMTSMDYHAYDYLIGMDTANIRNMHKISGGDPDRKISRLLDFTDYPGDIADPWYTGDFESTYRDVLSGCHAFVSFTKLNPTLLHP